LGTITGDQKMSTRRFGSRYGATVRKRVEKIERKKRARYICPHCRKKALEWVAVGLWVCKRCGFKMAGAAFEPISDVGAKLLNMLQQYKKSAQ